MRLPAIRKCLLFLLCACCLIAMPTAVAATEATLPDGFVIGDQDGIRASGEGEYFISASDLRPGDKITKTVMLHNLNHGAPYKLYLDIESLEATGPLDLFDATSLKITMDDKVLYEGRLRGDEGDTKLEDTLYLGTYKSGDQGSLKIELLLDDGSPMYTEKSVAEFVWKFHAVADANSIPKTGDDMKIAIYLIVAFFSAISAILLYIMQKKRKQQEQPEEPQQEAR